MKKTIIVSTIFFLLSCQSNNVTKEKKVIINSDTVYIKYINFTPTNIDNRCLKNRIGQILTIIENAKLAMSMRESTSLSEQLSKEFKYKIEKLEGFLLVKKHISTQGNHEWKEIKQSRHLIIENSSKEIYLVYPIEPISLIVSNKPINKIEDGETIAVRSLRKWIDVRKCFKW